MLSLTLALDLASAGLVWHPGPGDRFVVRRAEMCDEIFHLADMVIEARPLETGMLFAFNGTTEWALDSIPQADTVWLPTEAQLRDLLGSAFVSLNLSDDGFVVELSDGSRHRDRDPENAYARALLAHLAAIPH